MAVKGVNNSYVFYEKSHSRGKVSGNSFSGKLTKAQSQSEDKKAEDNMADKGMTPENGPMSTEEIMKMIGSRKNEILEKVEQMKEKAEGPKYPEVEPKEEITLDDFDKVQLRVGEILQCERVKKAKKLLVSQIRIGTEVRQIVSGIALHYTPEEMVGKKVAVITNLKPVKLCGLLSEGMILAAGDDEGNLSVLTVDKDIIAGSEIC